MSHTPGPWEVEPLEPGRKYYGTKVRLNADSVVEVWTNSGPMKASEREIANGWEPDHGFDHVESATDLANARLIAAAPELLEALKQLLDYTAACEGMLNASEAGQCKKARAAIAKAEGK
jgi:hypothetical protein